MLTYLIESKKGPLMIIEFLNEEFIEQYVNRFPQRLKATYQEVKSEEAEEIEKKINEKLATILIIKDPKIRKETEAILIKKYRLTQNLKSLDEKLN